MGCPSNGARIPVGCRIPPGSPLSPIPFSPPEGTRMDFNLTEENELWRTTVHEFADKEIRPTAAEFDREARFNEAAFRKMSAIGLLGLNIPEALGGAGVDAVGAALAIEELGWGDGGPAPAGPG